MTRSIAFLASVAALLLATPAWAQDPCTGERNGVDATPIDEALADLRDDLPKAGTLINDPAAGWQAYGDGLGVCLITDDAVPGGRALRLDITPSGGQLYAIGANADLTGDIATGDTILIAYHVRAVSAENESVSGVISALNIQENGPDYTPLTSTGALLPMGEWETRYHSFIAGRDLAAKDGMIALHLGGARQVLDLGPMAVLNLGPGIDLDTLPSTRLTYPGMAADAPWRAAARARIEEHRMGEISVTVRDAHGAPMPGVPVRIEMTNHAFGFGTFIGHDFGNPDAPDVPRLRESFEKTFNFATAPVYWQDWGWQNPDWRRNYLAAMDWLAERDIPFRAHTVIYPAERFVPSPVKELAGDATAVRAFILDHVRDAVGQSAQYDPCCFDVVNEMRTGGYLQSVAGEDIFIEAYRVAEETAPEAVMYVNDYGILSGGGHIEENISHYHAMLEEMIGAGAPVEGIGFQGHFGAALTHPARIVELLDEFSVYGLPIQVTEFDVDTRDEETQAAYTRDALTAVFSHPAADAFVVWGWWAGDHWRPDAAMLREDWSEKPNYEAWMDQIYTQWWTDETLTTGRDGTVTLRGFLGDYIMTAEPDGAATTAKATLTKDGLSVSLDMP